MPPYDDACVFCGRNVSVIDDDETDLRRFKCSACTTFEIGGEVEKYIEDNIVRWKDRLPLLSRAAQRATREGNGSLVISSISELIRIAETQEGWEQSQK